MIDATVTEILEPMSERTSRAGKTYRASKVELEIENGETARTLSFEDLEVGAVVKVKKNGEFWQIDTPKRGGVDLSGIESSLKSLHEKVDKLLIGGEGKEFARNVAKKIKDDVYEPSDDELDEYGE